MKKLKNILSLVIGLLVGFILAILFSLLTLPLWLIFLPWKLFDRIFNKHGEKLQTFEEFIFICYGLAVVCVILPLSILDNTDER